MFLRRKLNVCAHCESKLMWKSEVIFGEVVGRVSGDGDGRTIKGMALLLSMWLLWRAVE